MLSHSTFYNLSEMLFIYEYNSQIISDNFCYGATKVARATILHVYEEGREQEQN